MKSDKISVIVPIYNVELYLKRCIDSIIGQTYRNIEIILVDDGSPDLCPRICDEYSQIDSRIKVIHQRNGGLSAARNAGLDICSGTYIAFVDSDDYIHSKMLETLVRYCSEYDAEIAECNFVHFSGEKCVDSIKGNKEIHVYNTERMLIELHGFEGQKHTVVWNKLYKRELFSEIRFPLGKINEDEFTTYKLIDKASNIVVSEKVFYYYYRNENSITCSKNYLMRKDIFDAYNERINYFRQHNQEKILPVVKKAYLDRIIYRYKLIMRHSECNKKILQELKAFYHEKYKLYKDSIGGVGYRIFLFSPKLYITLVKYFK